MKIGSQVKFIYGYGVQYGTLIGVSEDRWSKGEWIVKFIEGCIATRNKKHTFKVSNLERLLYF